MQVLLNRALEPAGVEALASAMRSLVHVELRLQAPMWFSAER